MFFHCLLPRGTSKYFMDEVLAMQATGLQVQKDKQLFFKGSLQF